jgi:hypothetical protein
LASLEVPSTIISLSAAYIKEGLKPGGFLTAEGIKAGKTFSKEEETAFSKEHYKYGFAHLRQRQKEGKAAAKLKRQQAEAAVLQKAEETSNQGRRRVVKSRPST